MRSSAAASPTDRRRPARSSPRGSSPITSARCRHGRSPPPHGPPLRPRLHHGRWPRRGRRRVRVRDAPRLRGGRPSGRAGPPVDPRRTARPNRSPGSNITTVAHHPELLQRAYALARQGFEDMALRTGPATIDVDAWLREEASLPAGSFVALEHGIIVGYAGLLAWDGDASRAENGLTVVDRRWRGRGLATALKRRQLAWAACQRHPGDRHLDAGRQRGDAAGQHQARLRDPDDQPQDAARPPLTTTRGRASRRQ